MIRTFQYIITEKDEGITIEDFLKKEGYSKRLITKLRQTPIGLRVDTIHRYTTYPLSSNECLVVTLEDDTPSEHIPPVYHPLSIIYEDDDLMVLNKPANMPIHPSIGNYENTLANGVAYYFKEKNEPFIYRVINRLDRDTTGLIILAKHMLSAGILSNMVKNREIKREYLAITEGLIDEEGIIEVPIGRKEGSIIEREVNFTNGEYAKTYYKRLAYSNNHSLVHVTLETGRTHQIRVHMKHIHHPLPGDFIYNPNYEFIKRQALHSYKLTFPHPITKEILTFTAPLPKDMSSIISFPDNI